MFGKVIWWWMTKACLWFLLKFAVKGTSEFVHQIHERVVEIMKNLI